MKVKNFLCCFSLETGGLWFNLKFKWINEQKKNLFCYRFVVIGYVIGWMTLIWFLAFSIISAVSVLALSTTSCDEFKKLLAEYFRLYPDEKMFDELCKASRGGEILKMFINKTNLLFNSFHSCHFSYDTCILLLCLFRVFWISMCQRCNESEFIWEYCSIFLSIYF